MSSGHRIELKQAIYVEGPDNVRDLGKIISNTRRTGVLRLNVSAGNVSSAEFQEKIEYKEKSLTEPTG